MELSPQWGVQKRKKKEELKQKRFKRLKCCNQRGSHREAQDLIMIPRKIDRAQRVEKAGKKQSPNKKDKWESHTYGILPKNEPEIVDLQNTQRHYRTNRLRTTPRQ